MEELMMWNRRGLICGPSEPPEAFYQRVKQALPHSPASPCTLFDIALDWVPLLYQKEGLRAWEGACAWIDEKGVTLQFHPALQTKKSHLGYSREEILFHEWVHAARGMFQESRFEEMLAYQTSSNRFRRFFGPLFRKPPEVFYLLGTLFLGIVGQLFDWRALVALPFVLLSGLCMRLFWTQRIFRRARKQVAARVGAERALPLLLRLTDREIVLFSSLSPDAILAFAERAQTTSLRWRQIYWSYFV